MWNYKQTNKQTKPQFSTIKFIAKNLRGFEYTFVDY